MDKTTDIDKRTGAIMAGWFFLFLFFFRCTNDRLDS
jgi:hypothetical protein